ncbi:hypothetical protein CPB83DRAFT_870203 [Crepidotus variabilis]|uniref:Uncharacterized protein n=1 Tax=Crepidotus variabilis TaxID=179855 RepID=A0A9P6EDE5_9AGAR|nr:hypothetical protein CPB83DRAFT_870203 [Crepidotus variabilis]
MVQPAEQLDLSPDVVPVASPQDSVSSAGILSTAPPFVLSATANSLDTALDSTAVGRRSRANTSLSPPSLSSNFPSLSPPSLHPTPTADYPSTGSSSSADEGGPQTPPRAVIGQMLKEIAKTAIDAGTAFEKHHSRQQQNKVGELRDRIVQVLDMLAHLSVSHGETPAVMPIPISLLGAQAIQPVEAILNSLQASASEHPRKRLASELDDPQRVVKAMKREEQDDLSVIHDGELPSSAPPLSQSFMPQPIQPPFPAVSPYPATPSQPSSRAGTPPMASFPTSLFNPAAALPQTTFAPLATGGTPLPASSIPPSLSAGAQAPPFPLQHSSWSDPVVPTSRHQHSLSVGSASGSHLHAQSAASSSSPLRSAPMQSNGLPNGLHQMNASSSASVQAMGQPIGRMSRSGSISGTSFKNPYAKLTYPDNHHPHPDPATWHKSKKARNGPPSFFFNAESIAPNRTSPGKAPPHTASAPTTAHNSPSDIEDDDDDSDSDEDEGSGEVTSSTQAPGSASAATDMPPEFRPDVDRIFFEFLNKLCSNLDATCSKGEQIHQTLMAKKMQRLDESPDFRPFKFRILAFTNAFMDELAEQGFPEDKLPMKKVRNYLWRQQYILRFNEDGKKAKSKGNHIWSIEAKKSGDGKWEFRPFHRKLAGPPPGVAYAGLRWAWKPHIWDPQISFKKIHVTYSSPGLPPWLSWKNGELSGIPPPEAESCQVTATAKFVLDSQETELSHTFTISIAPVSALDGPSYSRSRRQSFAEQPPKRSTSDSALSSAPQRYVYMPCSVAGPEVYQMPRMLNGRARVDDRAVIQVLQNVVQRVTDEAESQFVAASPPKQGEIHALVKQKHVLEQTVNAYDKALSGHGHLQARRLAVAAQHVVLQAAQTIVADKSVAVGGLPTPEVESVSMHELTDKTQDAIAMAVKINGPASNEVDIIVTATSLLKQSTPATQAPPPPTASSRLPLAGPSAAPRHATGYQAQSTLSTLPEHV